MLKSTEREILRVDRQQNKLKEAYEIIEDQIEITDLNYSNRLFIYKNEVFDSHRVEVRRLKDDFNEYIADTTRPAV